MITIMLGMSDRSIAQQRYAEDELARQIADVAATGSGSRNRALNDAALAMGHYVGAGALTSERVERALTAAAVRAGLRPSEAASTIRSGLTAGAREPAFRHDREHRGERTMPTPPPAAPIDTDLEQRFQAAMAELAERCRMRLDDDGARYLRSRGLPLDASRDVITIPTGPALTQLCTDLAARHGDGALDATGLTGDGGTKIQWPRHRLGLVWRDAITGGVSTLQRRYLGKPAENVPKTVFARGRKVTWPWGAHLLRDVPRTAPVALVEGVIDWLAWRVLHPYPDAAPCIAVDSAKPLKPEWVALLAGRVVFVALDGDTAGETAATSIIEQLAACARPLRIRPSGNAKDWAEQLTARPPPDDDIERAAIISEVTA